MSRINPFYTFLTVVFMLIPAVAFPSGVAESRQSDSVGGIDYIRFRTENQTRPLQDLIKDAWRCICSERYDSAAAYYSVAASLYSESLPPKDIKRCAIACVNMGYIWVAWRMNAVEAYPWLMKARRIADDHGLEEIKTAVISNLGQIYLDYNNLPKAVEYYREALRRVVREDGSHYYGRALMDFTVAAILSNRPDLIGEAVADGMRFNLPENAPLYAYTAKLQKALNSLVSGDARGAAETMEAALPLFDVETDRQRYLCMHHLIAARMWMEAGDYKKGAESLRSVIGIASERGYFNLMEKGYADLVECSLRTGDTAAADNYRFRGMQIRDSLFNASRFEIVKDLEVSGELNDLHEKAREAAMEASMQRQRTLWASVAGIILLVAVVFLTVSQRRLRSAYREIFKRNMELSQAMSGPSDEPHPSGEESPAYPSDFDEASAREVLARVMAVIDENQEIFNPDFSVERLAELVGSRPKTVSQAINILAGKNFNTLLGEHRIREACRILADPEKYRMMSMEGVAESVGYRSRTYFSKVFKSVTGLTPSQFVKQAKES